MASEASLERMIVELLLDPHVRDTCGVYIKPWMFTKKVYERTVTALLGDNFTGRRIDQKVFTAFMRSNYPDLDDSDWSTVNGILTTVSPISDHDFGAVVGIVSTFIKDRFYQKGTDLLTKNRKVEAEEYFVQATMFKITENPFVNPLEDGVLDRLKAKDMPTGGQVIRSSLGLVNSSLLYGGYKNADLVMVCLRPKGGKTTFMCQEGAAAAQQNFNVAHMFFGDCTEFDGICRYMSTITGDPLIKIIQNYNHYKKKCERWLDHLRVAAFPAMSMDCHEVVAHVRRLKKQFDANMVILDYDLNIRPPKELGMYETGGVMYSTFKGMGESERLVVMIGSQTKQQFWNMEVPPMESAAESSRKQHAIDIMINGGRNPDYKGIGTFYLPLVRRGVSDSQTRVRFDDANSRIVEITPQAYERLLLDNKNRDDTSGDTILEGIKFSDKFQPNEAA